MDQCMPEATYASEQSVQMPLVSIVTVALNADMYIHDTIASVREQSYPRVEFLVIDGGSQDRTVEIITRNEDAISWWTSEADSGISEAMNKGLGRARGEYILFLHADDYLCSSSSIQDAVEHLGDGADIVAFDILLKDGERLTHRKPRGWGPLMKLKTGLLHQGTLCRRDLFGRIGEFDVSLKIAMDYDFFFRAYCAGVRVKRVPQPLSVMRTTGISARKDWPTLIRRFGEERRIHHKYCTSALGRLGYTVYWPAYLSYRYARHLLSRKCPD